MPTRSRTIWSIVAAAASVLAIGGVMAESFASARPITRVRRRLDPAISRTELTASLVRLGLDPQALAAAGVSAEATGQVVGDLRSYLLQHGVNLMQLEQAHLNARSALDSAEAAVRAGKRTQEALGAVQTARTALASAATSRDTAQTAAFEAATASLDADQIASLLSIKRNRSWHVPLEYAVEDRSEAQWMALHDALVGARTAQDRGEPAPLVLNGLDVSGTDPAVSAARAALANNSAAVTAAWNQAIGQ